MISHVVISMAGKGTRLGQHCPKGLVDIDQHKLVWYLLQNTFDIPDVRIVVGYCAEKVIDYVRSIRNDVTFVHNDIYETTSCAFSINMGCRDIDEPYLIVDGDLLLNCQSFRQFVNQTQDGKTLIGITLAKTQDAVFVELDSQEKNILSFTRKPVSKWEWSGVAYINGFTIESSEQFICDTLAKHLPLRCQPIDCYEIDTPADYQLALEHLGELGYDLP
ncbi:MAG: NTP transferase domain-containing protein [Planctomycetia bacterium]|nr:NTP transferase domain-containing protein [Planctomycetia bacterium]